MSSKTSALATLTHTTIVAGDYFPVIQAAGPTSKRITLTELHQTPLTANMDAGTHNIVGVGSLNAQSLAIGAGTPFTVDSSGNIATTGTTTIQALSADTGNITSDGSGNLIVVSVNAGTSFAMGGAGLHSQQANTVGPATAMRTFGFIAAAGTLYGDWTPAGTATQTANVVLAGPSSGAAATPTFRAAVIADLPIASCTNQSGTSYTMDGTVNNVFLSNTSARAVTLSASPATYKGQRFCVKDIGNTTSGITITPNSGTIDGAASYNFTTALGSRDIISDGTNWWVV